MGHFRVSTNVVVIDIYLYDYYYDSGHFQVAFGMGRQGPETEKPPVINRRPSRGGVNPRIRRSRSAPSCR